MTLGWRRGSLLLVVLAAAIWLPRGLALDRFVTTDEPRWLVRSANFYQALAHGDFVHTFQRHHPGVVTMWLGMGGYLWRFPGYASEAQRRYGSEYDKDLEYERFLALIQATGHRPVDLLAAGRFFVVLAITLILLLAFRVAASLVGLLPALAGVLLIAFDPFFIAHSRVLHLDALLSSLMLLSVLAFLRYLHAGRRRGDLLLSAIAAGLAWLAKSPGLFLIPFVGLLAAVKVFGPYVQGRHDGGRTTDDGLPETATVREHNRGTLSLASSLIRPLALWGAVAAVVFVALWPAIWVEPVGSLSRVFNNGLGYAESGHDHPVYFNGEIVPENVDPGWHFYPITYLWRATPVVLTGLFVAAIAALLGRARLMSPAMRWLTLALFAFAVLFTLFMSLSAKKFDRYLLPVYPTLDLVAGMGWAAAASGLGSILARRRRTENGGRTSQTSEVSRTSKVFSQPATSAQLTADRGRLTAGRRRSAVGGLSIAVVAFAVAIQALSALPTFPYYFSYYNPLLGGSRKAPEVMMIGWGEGLDQVARYLNAKPDAEQRKALVTWFEDGSFTYFYNGETLSARFSSAGPRNLSEWLRLDDVVLYAQQWQLQERTPEVIAHFADKTPERVIRINGIEYARVYDVRGSTPPEFMVLGRPRFTDWGAAIRLVSYELPDEAVMPGERFVATFYLENLAPIERDL
ncbi:MAG TPA: glycosyltransferase family 39 protein, partial [Ardenticatenaceae bacterium]|nr:glycosyltransferase family 39 protein [Ardenticatenaceae bacterium]